jgi:hypothetical protein
VRDGFPAANKAQASQVDPRQPPVEISAARQHKIDARPDDTRLVVTGIGESGGPTNHLLLAALAGHVEAPEADDDQAPVRRCHRYLSGRRNHLNYHDALANDLPIGSGEIESAHRYIAQQRLKRPGAWWRVDHAEYMLALRINRRNGDWAAYWATFGKTASPANQNRPAGSRKSAA